MSWRTIWAALGDPRLTLIMSGAWFAFAIGFAGAGRFLAAAVTLLASILYAHGGWARTGKLMAAQQERQP